MSNFEYFVRYGNEGTTGRYNSYTSRGGFSDELNRHTAIEETRSWVTPTPTPSISVTPTISITPTVTPTLTATPTVTATPTISVSATVTATPTTSA